MEDKRDGYLLPEHKFVIRLMPVNNIPPRMVDTSSSVVTSQGGTILIGPAVINVVDQDIRVHDLTFTLTKLPSAGDFVKKTATFQVTLREGEH